MKKGMKKGQLYYPKITKELIYEEWVVNRLSQKEISIKYNVPLWLIENRIKKFKLTGIRTKIKYILNYEHINLESPVFWYLIGLTISDGYIDEKNKRILISLTEDFEILEILSNFYSTSVKIPVYKYNSNTKGKYRYVLTLSNEDLINLFHSLNIYGYNKTYAVTMPDPGNKYLFNFLLRGFIDGDGYITYRKYNIKIKFYIESLNLVNSLNELYYKYFNQYFHIYKHKKLNGSFRNGRNVESKEDSFKELLEIYSEIPELALKRKRIKIKNKVDDIVHLYEMINHRNW